jgi:hypothetical protein
MASLVLILARIESGLLFIMHPWEQGLQRIEMEVRERGGLYCTLSVEISSPLTPRDAITFL